MAKGTILLTGGTGKISTRLVPLLSSAGYVSLVASRSGTSPSLPNTSGIKFDWFDASTHASLLSQYPIDDIFLISPPALDCFPNMKSFIDLAIHNKIRRFVFLGGSVLDVGNGPLLLRVSQYIISLKVEYTILRPSWFMENFSELQHQETIRNHNQIISAAGDGKVPFIAAADIAAVAFRALTDEVSHNTDYLLLGPDLLSYDDVADILSTKLQRKISHVKITEDELAKMMEGLGVPVAYAKAIAELDTTIKNGEEERLNDVFHNITGEQPRRFESYVDEGVEKGIWG